MDASSLHSFFLTSKASGQVGVSAIVVGANQVGIGGRCVGCRYPWSPGLASIAILGAILNACRAATGGQGVSEKYGKKQQDPMVVRDFHPWNLKLLFGVEAFFRHINIVINPCHAMPPLISLEFRNALEGLRAESRWIQNCYELHPFSQGLWAYDVCLQYTYSKGAVTPTCWYFWYFSFSQLFK